MNDRRLCSLWAVLLTATCTVSGWCVSVLPGWPVLAGGISTSSPALGDIDGDGDLEVISTSANQKIHAWHHDGRPVAGWPQPTTAAVHCTPALGDLDNDGDLEVLAAGTAVYVWHGDGNPAAGWPRLLVSVTYASPALGDLDNDGDLEVVVPGAGDGVYAWHGDGRPVAGWPQAASCTTMPLALGDLDGDGRLEVVCTCTDFTVRAWRGDGTPLPGWPQVTDGTIFATPTLGDVDNDGALEVVVAGAADATLHVWEPSGSPTPGWPREIVPRGGGCTAVLADLNSDGLLDILIGSSNYYIHAWHGNGLAMAGWPQFVPGSPQDTPAVADLDGDGDPEVLVGTSFGDVHALHGSGAPVSGWPQETGGTAGPPNVADVDGDGFLEVFAGCTDSMVYAWRCDTPSADVFAWPMCKHDASHRGCYSGMPGRILGTVKSATDGIPLADATVRVRSGGLLLVTVITGASGRYAAQELPPGVYSVTAQAPDHLAVTHVVAVDPWKTTYDNLTLRMITRISGQVRVRGTTVNIAGATVTVSAGTVVKATATTAANGIYVANTDLPTGIYVIAAAKTGYLTQTKANVSVTQGATTYVNFNLDPVCLKGQVKEAGTLANLARATVKVYQEDVLKASAVTNAGGIYEISGLADGTYTVIATRTGYVRQARLNVLVNASAVTYVNFSLAVSGKLRGQVKDKDSGLPIIGATVVARMGGVIRASATTTAPYGVYEIASDLTAGTYVVGASMAGYLGQTRKDIPVTAGATTYVNFGLQPQ